MTGVAVGCVVWMLEEDNEGGRDVDDSSPVGTAAAAAAAAASATAAVALDAASAAAANDMSDALHAACCRTESITPSAHCRAMLAS